MGVLNMTTHTFTMGMVFPFVAFSTRAVVGPFSVVAVVVTSGSIIALIYVYKLDMNLFK